MTRQVLIPNNSSFSCVGRTPVNILEIFLRELWEPWWWICAVAVVISIAVLVRFASKGYLTFFTSTGSFPELAAFTKDDQLRLLREASREVFSALTFVPILVFIAFLMGGLALARTLQEVTALNDWVVIVLIVLPCLFAGLGIWLGHRLEARSVRPFLRKLIDRQNGKTVAP
jgi:hypothetical protein